MDCSELFSSTSIHFPPQHPRNKPNQATELLLLGGLTIIGTTAAVLIGKGAYCVTSYGCVGACWGASRSWNATKWIARNGWNTTKTTPGAVWGATKWTASTGFSIAKYVVVNLPEAIKWTTLTIWGATKWAVNTAWSCTKWAFICIRHPIASIENAFNNAIALFKGAWSLATRGPLKIAALYEAYALPAINGFVDVTVGTVQNLYQFGSKHVQIMAHDLNEAFPITGRVTTKVKGYALIAFGFVSSKTTAIAEKVFPYNPVPWLFEKAPSMKTPTFVAMGAAASSLAADLVKSRGQRGVSVRGEANAAIKRAGCANYLRKRELELELWIADNRIQAAFRNHFRIDFFIMMIGTITLAPRIANYFSKHTVTQMQATGWGLTFLAMKTIANSNFRGNM